MLKKTFVIVGSVRVTLIDGVPVLTIVAGIGLLLSKYLLASYKSYSLHSSSLQMGVILTVVVSVNE